MIKTGSIYIIVEVSSYTFEHLRTSTWKCANQRFIYNKRQSGLPIEVIVGVPKHYP